MMISRSIITSLIAALLLGAAQASNHRSPQIHYTRQQRRARGVWKTAVYPTAKPAWIAINLGDSRNSMSVLWPWGLGCWNLPAEIHGNKIHIKREDLAATITIQGGKTATLRMEIGKTVIPMKKTSNDPAVLCE